MKLKTLSRQSTSFSAYSDTTVAWPSSERSGMSTRSVLESSWTTTCLRKDLNSVRLSISRDKTQASQTLTPTSSLSTLMKMSIRAKFFARCTSRSKTSGGRIKLCRQMLAQAGAPPWYHNRWNGLVSSLSSSLSTFLHFERKDFPVESDQTSSLSCRSISISFSTKLMWCKTWCRTWGSWTNQMMLIALEIV